MHSLEYRGQVLEVELIRKKILNRSAHRSTYPTAREVARAMTLSGTVRTRYDWSPAVISTLRNSSTSSRIAAKELSFNPSAFWMASRNTTLNHVWRDPEGSARCAKYIHHSMTSYNKNGKLFSHHAGGGHTFEIFR